MVPIEEEAIKEAAYQARRDYQDEVGKNGMNDCIMLDAMKIQKGFELGAKWSAERMYSEEEVKEIIKLSFEEGMLIQRTINDKVKIPYMRMKDFTIRMFEQFKKK